MNLKNLMIENNVSRIELAKRMGVSTSQIDKWCRLGISVNCKHFGKLRQIFPGLTPKEVTIRKDGETEDLRFRAGRPKMALDLDELEDVEHTHSKISRISSFPKIKFRKSN